VKQRNYGEEHDNNQNPTWLRVHNPGPARTVTVRLIWATFRWMGYRELGYVKQNGAYATIKGRLDPTATTYEFRAPRGESYFGAFPWYTNEDADRTVQSLCRRSPMCAVRSIGATAEGRDLKCITIQQPGGRRKKANVVIFGRFHATEASSSFAVDGTARFILGKRAPEWLLQRYAFHLVPVANPDGTAHGLKLTRPGPVEKYDLVPGGLSSDDPTIRAIREEVRALRPAVFISHHCYQMPIPWLGVFDKRVGVKLLDLLVDDKFRSSASWTVRFTGPEHTTLRHYCHEHFRSTVVFTELPWQGRLPSDIEELGREVFLATMTAHESRAGKDLLADTDPPLLNDLQSPVHPLT